MLSDGSKTYTYNVLNRLVSFTNGPVTANYGYLPNGLRAYKSVNDGTNSTYNSFVWDGDTLIYEYKSQIRQILRRMSAQFITTDMT